VRERFLLVAAGLGQAMRQALLPTALQFIVQEQGQELDRRQLLLRGLGGTHIEGLYHAAELELAQFG
jgi:hypothetical protein